MAANPAHLTSKAFPSIRRALQYIEWALLTINAVGAVGEHIFNGGRYAPPGAFYIILVALGICAGLSLLFPSERPLWQRRAYIALEMSCLIVVQHITSWNPFNLLQYLVLAKSCFLLSPKDAILTAIATWVASQISLALRLPEMLELMRTQLARDLSSDLKHLVLNSLVFNTQTYWAFSTLILLLCFLVLAERKSRQKAFALFQEVEILAADLERTRIARDIHDSLGHTLTTLNVQLELAQTLHSPNPARALLALNTAKSLTIQSLQEVRRAVSTMREGGFDLNAALNSLVEQMNQTQTFKIDAQINLPKLPLQVSQQLYLIFKEGLTNMQKHSQASSIHLWTQSTTEEITLGLSDDGVGFDPQMPSAGFGLRGMQERVQLLSGQMKIHSAPGKGTLIQVSIPR